LQKLYMSDQEWKKMTYMIELLRSFHDWTQRIDKTRDSTVHFVFSAYNSLFDHLKNQRIKCDIFEISWFDDLSRALKKASNKLSKYYAMTDEKRDILYNVDILLDSIEKLAFYQICCLTNIFHEYFSRTLLFHILNVSYKANAENHSIFHFTKINSNSISIEIIRSNSRSTLAIWAFSYKKMMYWHVF
jgi:hypothetical protein